MAIKKDDEITPALEWKVRRVLKKADKMLKTYINLDCPDCKAARKKYAKEGYELCQEILKESDAKRKCPGWPTSNPKCGKPCHKDRYWCEEHERQRVAGISDRLDSIDRLFSRRKEREERDGE